MEMERGNAGLSRMLVELEVAQQKKAARQFQADEYMHGHARVIFDSIMMEIDSFERSLKDTEEVGCYLSSFGQTFFIQIESVSYAQPYLIVFEGLDVKTGQRVKLAQHTTQVSVLFMACEVPKESPRPARRLGFATED